MPDFSPMEVLLSVATALLSIYVFITKSAFFKGRQSVKQELDDENQKLVPQLILNVTTLTNEVKYLLESHKSLSSKVSAMDKAVLLQDAKLVQLDKLFDRIISQSNEIQKNLVENSQAVHSLGNSVEGMRELLDNLIKGNLIIRKDGK